MSRASEEKLGAKFHKYEIINVLGNSSSFGDVESFLFSLFFDMSGYLLTK